MNMVKVKTSELTGAALDWAVAKALGYDVFINPFNDVMRRQPEPIGCYRFSPSTDWHWAGQVIEQHKVQIKPFDNPFSSWSALYRGWWGYSDSFASPLQALCRAIATSGMRDVVEVPQDLISSQG